MKRNIFNVFAYAILFLLVIICIIPFYIMIVNATHTTNELMVGLYMFPGTALFDNFKNLNELIDIGRGFLNSAIITISVTLITAYFGTMTAFGLAKYEFKGKKIVFILVMLSLMVPSQLGIVGFFRLCKYLNILDSFWPLILPAFANASTVFFVRQYIISAVPDSLIEACRVEGGGELHLFNYIILPLCKPVIATMAIFNFVGSWNNFLTPMIILFTQKNFTLPLLIMNLRGAFNRDFGATYCALALSIIPIIIVYCFMSKKITDSMMDGAVKG